MWLLLLLPRLLRLRSQPTPDWEDALAAEGAAAAEEIATGVWHGRGPDDAPLLERSDEDDSRLIDALRDGVRASVSLPRRLRRLRRLLRAPGL
jgi:hypothetical protein